MRDGFLVPSEMYKEKVIHGRLSNHSWQGPIPYTMESKLSLLEEDNLDSFAIFLPDQAEGTPLI